MRHRALAINVALSAIFGVVAMVRTGLAVQPQAKAAESSTELPAGVKTGPVALASDYLNLSVGSTGNPGTQMGLSWDGVSGKTYKVQWKKSSGGPWDKREVDAGTIGVTISNDRWSYVVGNLSCNTSYDFRVKMEGRGWKSKSAATSNCGSAACQIAVGGLVLNSTASHVFFIGTDQRVYNHWWDGNTWQLGSLGPAQIAAGSLVPNSTASHVFFIDTDKRVYNYWWNGNAWQLGSLGPAQIAAVSLFPLVLNSAASHVFSIGTDQRVYNYWWNGNTWQLDWLGPAQIAAGNLVRLVPNSSADHVFFIGTDKRVYNYWWNGTTFQLDWLGPAQIAAGNPVLNSSADHVFFIGSDKRVYNYWWNGKWQLDWLCT
jgi:hypothetical protein